MICRRFVPAVLFLLAISVGIALTLRASSRLQQPQEQSPTTPSLDLRDTQLLFPKGLVVDAGTVPENAQVLFSLPFINAGSGIVDVAHFQICETCFKGARLKNPQRQVAPGETGTLEFEVTTGARAGRTTVGAQVEYAKHGPQLESSKNPHFTVFFSYLNDSPGICNWEQSNLDFGELTSDVNPPARRISLIQQLRSDLTPQIHLRTEGTDEILATVVSERDAPSVLNLPGTAYEIEIKLQPRPEGNEKGLKRGVIIAETPLGERKLDVQWNLVTDYVLRPANGVIFASPEKELSQVVSIRSARSRAFRILSAVCDIHDVEPVVNASAADAVSQTFSLRVPKQCPAASGRLAIRLRERWGDEHEEVFPCRIMSLATEPTPAVAE